jgi:hypothetical protein
VFLKWFKATTTSYSHHLYPPKNSVDICQYYGFTSMTMLFYWLIILNTIISMIDNDQSTIIEAPEGYKSIPTHSPTAKPTTEWTWDKNVDFDTFDGHVMVNYIEPNLQEIIFGPIRVGLTTQKQFWDHLQNCHSWGQTPNMGPESGCCWCRGWISVSSYAWDPPFPSYSYQVFFIHI